MSATGMTTLPSGPAYPAPPTSSAPIYIAPGLLSHTGLTTLISTALTTTSSTTPSPTTPIAIAPVAIAPSSPTPSTTTLSTTVAPTSPLSTAAPPSTVANINTSPTSATWSWKWRVCSNVWQDWATLIAVLTALTMIYYTVRTYNLAAWTAEKDFCEYKRVFENNTISSKCSVDHPPIRRSQVKRIQASSAAWSETKRLFVNLSLMVVGEFCGSIALAVLFHKGFFWLPRYRADPQRLLRSQEEHNLGCLYRNRGWVDTAEDMFRRALETREKALGRDHTSTLATVNELSLVYGEQGKLDKAEEMFLRVLQGHEKALGRDHTLTLATVNKLSLVYRDQGKLEKAEEMFRRVLEGHEKSLGHGHTSTLATVNELGLVYRNQGKLDMAEEMFQRALEGREKALGHDHTSTLATVNELGLVYRDQGKPDTAEEMFRRALEGREKVLGRDHASTLATVNELGLVYRDQGKLDNAAEMFWRVLEGHEKALGRDYTLMLPTVNRKALGRDYTSTLATVNELGIVYRNQGKPDKAEEMFRRVLEGHEKVLGAQSHVDACYSQEVGHHLQRSGQAGQGRGDVLAGT